MLIIFTKNKQNLNGFLTENNNSIQYTKAKIIDMYGFNKGYK